MSYVGYSVGRPDLPFVAISEGNIRAIPGLALPAGGFVTRLGFWGYGSTIFSGSAKAMLGLYLTDAAGNPTTLLGRTNYLSVAGGTTAWEAPLVAPVAVAAGQGLAIVVRASAGTINVGQVDGSTVLQRTRTFTTGYLPDPFNASGTVTAPLPAVYAVYAIDTLPTAVQSSPAAGATVVGAAPTFTGAMTDADIAAYGDHLSRVAFEVRQVGQTALLWGGAAANLPASGASFAVVYAGSSLTPGVSYEWRVRVADAIGNYSAWTGWRGFTVAPFGRVTTTQPSGKQDGNPATIGWAGNWSHPTGLAANAMQARVLLPDGVTVARLGPLTAVTVAGTTSLPGTAFTLTATQAGVGTLPPGGYFAQLRGRSTDGVVGDWSAPLAFAVNAPATTPTNLQPPSGAVSTSLPLLEWNAGDPDPDDVPGVDVTWTVKFIAPNGATFTRTASAYDPARGVASYQTLSSDLTAFGTWQWQVQGADLSAGSFGLSPFSVLQRFDYVAGPVVTITNPAPFDTEATAVPTVTWTVAGGIQTAFQVTAYRKDATLPFKTSGKIASATQSFTIPASWFANNAVYDLTVTVFTSTTQGTSLRQQFTVSYTPPAALTGFAVSTYQPPGDPEASSAILTWDATVYPPGEFGGYVIRRRTLNQAVEDATILPTITNPNQTVWVDYYAPVNEPVIYTISQYRVSGGPAEEGAPVEAIITIPLRIPILVSALDPTTYRAPMLWLNTDFNLGFTRPEAAYVTWGGEGRPTLLASPPAYGGQSLDLTITLRDTGGPSMIDQYRAVQALAFSGHPLLFRGEHERMFCKASGFSAKRGDTPGTRQVQLSLDEIAFVEGQQPAV